MTIDAPQREYPLREVFNGIHLQVVKLPEAKKGFVLLPRRWVLERSFGWMAHFRRLSCDYERLADTLNGLHFLAFAMHMAHRFVHALAFCLQFIPRSRLVEK